MSNITSLGFAAVCNATITSSDECTNETCCLEQGQVQYIPSLTGNAFFAAVFGLLLVAHLGIGIRYRMWSFFTWMSLGLLGEVVGYVGRIMLHNDVFSFDAFLTYLIPLTIAPAFLTASIYLCLARIIHSLDPNLTSSRLKPMTYTKIFVCSDVVSLILQGAGGGLAATADDETGEDTGVNVMIAGLAFQVISLVVFIALCSDFAYRLYRDHGSPSTKHFFRSNLHATPALDDSDIMTTTSYHTIRASRMFKLFIWGLAAAVLFILIRSAYRLAELKDGFDGKLANDEVTFMILEGPMIILACLGLTVFHPGFAMRGLWSMKEFERRSADARAQTRKLSMVDVSSADGTGRS